MQRSRQIFAHGLTGKSVAVFTLGYWPAFAIVGKLCIGTVSMTVPGVGFTLTVPSVSFAMTKPSATIDMESC